MTEKFDQDDMYEVEEEEAEVEDTEDGGAVIRFDDEKHREHNTEHFQNIVDEVDQKDLDDFVDDLLDKISKDKEARKRRDDLYEEGLRRTGLGDDAPGGAQFTGATRVVHPLMVEACVDFAAKAMRELFPASGPVRSKIIGMQNADKLEKAQRVADFNNWQLTEQIMEFRSELEQLVTQLPLGGGQYLKWIWCNKKKRAMAEFIAIDDMLLPFAATNFYTAERKTHVQYITAMEYNKRVDAGVYREVDLGSADEPDFSKASKANDKIEGREFDSYNEDGLRTVYEVYTCNDFNNGDGHSPYVITIDKSTKKALSLYRNWDAEDEDRQELYWIIEFPFVPWRGAYPIGLTHMIGTLSGAATGALRALLDSAHIQNIPTAIKLKGGPNGQTITLQPTEIAEIEGGPMADDIRKLIMPIPFNPPSNTLFSLLGFLVDTGKGVVQTSFEKLTDQNPNQPVGTTMALIEQGMVVFSAIHARLHNSMGMALKVLNRINSCYLTEEILKKQCPEGLEVKLSDFDGPLNVIPVSDPNIFSDVQRFAQIQAILQRSANMPQLYDQRKVEEMFLRQMKVSDDILVEKQEPENLDPVSENVAMTMGKPAFVLMKQDHIAHLQVHLGFIMSPVFGQNPVFAQTLLPQIVNHLRDHMLLYYLIESHSAIETASKQGLPEDDAMQQSQVILQVQQAIDQIFPQHSQILAQVQQMAQQFIPPMTPPDNSMAVAQISADVQRELAQLKSQEAQGRLQLDQMKLQLESQIDMANQQLNAQKLQFEQWYKQQQLVNADEKLAADAINNDRTLQAKVLMNEQDNNTALEIAGMEVASGEKIAVESGGGINP